jgi:hypothetical protein
VCPPQARRPAWTTATSVRAISSDRPALAVPATSSQFRDRSTGRSVGKGAGCAVVTVAARVRSSRPCEARSCHLESQCWWTWASRSPTLRTAGCRVQTASSAQLVRTGSTEVATASSIVPFTQSLCGASIITLNPGLLGPAASRGTNRSRHQAMSQAAPRSPGVQAAQTLDDISKHPHRCGCSAQPSSTSRGESTPTSGLTRSWWVLADDRQARARRVTTSDEAAIRLGRRPAARVSRPAGPRQPVGMKPAASQQE